MELMNVNDNFAMCCVTGMNNRQLAAKFEITPETAERWRNKPEVLARIQQLELRILEKRMKLHANSDEILEHTQALHLTTVKKALSKKSKTPVKELTPLIKLGYDSHPAREFSRGSGGGDGGGAGGVTINNVIYGRDALDAVFSRFFPKAIDVEFSSTDETAV